MFKPGDLPSKIRNYHGPPGLAAARLPEYYPLYIDTKFAEDIRLNSPHSRQSRYRGRMRLPIALFKYHCSKRLL